MKRWFGRALACWGVLLPISVSAAADEPAAPDARSILRRADAATRAVRAFTYEAEAYGEGFLASRLPRVHGTLKARQGRRGLLSRLFGGRGAPPMMRYQGEFTLPGGGRAQPFDIATDGRQTVCIDADRKQFTCCENGGDNVGLFSNQMFARRLFMLEYLHPTPFSDEIHAKEARYEGIREVAGVPCHVIYVVYNQRAPDSRWYFGIKDSLPRRVDRIYHKGDRHGSQTLTLAHLDTSPDLSMKDFRPQCPVGYQRCRYAKPEEPKLLAKGTEAPDWSLKTPEGVTVRLRRLRGKVVVMAFWATWSGPSKMAMPGIQRLQEQFADQPVEVFAIHCWDRDGDPVAYMKTKQFTYTLLLDGDAVADAYRVSGIPTCYVIDPRGRVACAVPGILPERDRQISQVVQRALKQVNASR